jgi:transposase-like protein
MARKGIKQNKYNEEFISQIVAEKLNENKSYRFLAKKYDIPEGTIITWVYKFKKSDTVERKKRGKRKVTEETNYKEKYDILKKYLEYLEEVEQEKK